MSDDIPTRASRTPTVVQVVKDLARMVRVTKRRSVIAARVVCLSLSRQGVV